MAVDKTTVGKPEKLVFVQVAVLDKIDFFDTGMIPEAGCSEGQSNAAVLPVFPLGLNQHVNIFIVGELLIGPGSIKDSKARCIP